MSQRTILHVDMDAFFASVEVLDDPCLKGKPVIVGGTPEGRGVVSAASYEAREYGVRSAMSAARAVRLCPDGVFLRGRMSRYSEISGQIFDVFHSITPLVEPLSVDEAFLDVTGCRRLLGDGPTIGRLIKQRILDEVGLVASVGVASNKYLAKLASDLDKPDGFVEVPDDVQGFLDPLEVSRIWGVGPRSQAVLESLGIRTMKDVRLAEESRLTARLGPAHTAHITSLARGEDDRPVITDHEAKSIGHEVTFAEDIADRESLVDMLDQMAHKVGRRLRRAGTLARTVQLKARYADFTTKTRALTLPEPTDSTRLLRDTARRLLDDHLDRRGRPLRLIGMSARNFDRGTPTQGDLFAAPADERDRTLDGLMDDAAEKWGGLPLTRGVQSLDPGSREGHSDED